MTTSFSLAVVAGDGIGPEVTAQALKVLDVVAQRAGLSFDTHRVRPGRASLARDGRDPARHGARGDPRPRRDPARRGRRPGVPVGRARARPAAAAALRARPLRQPASVEAVPRRRRRRWPTRATSTSSSSARAPRVRTSATAAPSASARRTSSPPRSASTRRSASSGSSATPSPAPRPVRAASSRSCTRTTCSCTPATCGAARSTPSRAEFPDVSVDYLHVDAATIFLVTDPARFDVIVTDNLFGDILTDLAAAITGGIGLAASGNVNPDRTAPSMFEPVHGSAPDIAGQSKADPTAAILSARPAAGPPRPRRGGRGRSPPPSRPTSPSATVSRVRPRRWGRPSRHAWPERYRSPNDLTLHHRKDYRDHHDLHPVRPPDRDQPAREDRRAAHAILADPGFGNHFTDHMFLAEWTPDTAGPTPASCRTARCRSTRPPRSCTTRRRSSIYQVPRRDLRKGIPRRGGDVIQDGEHWSFTMARAIALRSDFSGVQLRALARRSKDAVAGPATAGACGDLRRRHAHARRRGSATSRCRSCATGCCASTPKARPG